MEFHFGQFVLDTGARRLLTAGRDVHLTPKAFTLLELLVMRRPDAVSKAEIHDALWPATNVVEANIANLVGEIRTALGDDTRLPRYIRTVPRFGYAFNQGIDDAHPSDRRFDVPRSQPVSPSLAVLAFANSGRDSEDDYFSDGLAEEIINALTRVSGLKVIARTSAFAFKGKNADVRKIAQALGVTNVLEGSVRRAGSRLRVTARLIHAADGIHLWSQSYDRELTDIFAVQDEIAAAIAGTLRLKLTDQPTTAHPYEPSLLAYDTFLKAKPLLQTRLFFKTWEEQAARAEQYLKQAIALDPQWATPRSALALHYSFGALGSRRSEMVALARSEASKALELLPSEPMAHAVLGHIAAVQDYDWKEADEQFTMARASAVVSLSVHDMYAASYLSPLGRFEEALQQTEKVIAQDPLNMLCRGRQVQILILAEMYERAIVESQKALEFDERHNSAHSVIALAHFLQGKLPEAREWAEEAFRRTPLNPLAVGLLAGLRKESGETEHAEKLLTTMRMVPLGMIVYHLVCSEIDAALDCYEQAIEQRHPYAVEWASGGLLRPLRSRPRWPQLARMMNLAGAG